MIFVQAASTRRFCTPTAESRPRWPSTDARPGSGAATRVAPISDRAGSACCSACTASLAVLTPAVRWAVRSGCRSAEPVPKSGDHCPAGNGSAGVATHAVGQHEQQAVAGRAVARQQGEGKIVFLIVPSTLHLVAGRPLLGRIPRTTPQCPYS